jgi:hypothetical protein
MESPSSGSDKAGALIKFVGAIVIYYALLEHWIDGMVATIYLRVDLAKEVRKHYPFNARDEVDFLRESFERLDALEPFKEDAVVFLDKLEPLAELRHNVVHGHIRPIDWETETFEFSRIVRGDGKKPFRRTMTILGSELYHQGEDIRALITPARQLTHRLVAAFGSEDELDKLAGSL